MKLITITRNTKQEKRFTQKMGMLYTNVTYIKKAIFGIIPISTIHKYRETYYGKVKDCEQCVLSK
ncbi:hypothetical protein [Arenibacter latericius]|uniref:hypothetical protein n=1 Tax=Arenibacter latericius TaxID=86104 RepID=UPI000403AB7B|nr:hypothetical protein [Arenibacter latericius]MDX1363205.1 hypothetical protein [Arenibacter latericius]